MARILGGFAGGVASTAGGLLWLMMRGKLTLDLGWGRSLHTVGPLTARIEAPRPLVFQLIAGPYLGRTPREAREHLEVWERSADAALARHFSRVSFYTAETVETLRFEEPERVTFRHVRGPVPHVTEEFVLREVGDATHFSYHGELGIDFWFLGRIAGQRWVVPEWERQVRPQIDQLKARAEARADAGRRRGRRTDA